MSELVGAVTSATLGSALERSRSRADDERRRRRAAAKELLDLLDPIVDRLRVLEELRGIAYWRTHALPLFKHIERVEELTPSRWRHLRLSLREALGNGVDGAVALVEHQASDLTVEVEYNRRWSDHALEYIEMVARQVRRWEGKWTERSARAVALPSFNDWLITTGRWVP